MAGRLLCHPNDPALPDCYRRVVIYGEPVGRLAGMTPRPGGVLGDFTCPRCQHQSTSLNDEMMGWCVICRGITATPLHSSRRESKSWD
jgi:hypothetical protein